ncbi:MAG: aspartyl-phosphate phosphatase Spo0E family protein [Thermaerobacterales bacterium]
MQETTVIEGVDMESLQKEIEALRNELYDATSRSVELTQSEIVGLSEQLDRLITRCQVLLQY